MAMDMTTALVILLLFVIVYASYSARSLRTKIWCSFRRLDRTKIEKFAKQNQRRVEFDNGWYYVNPRRTTLMLWNKGIHALIPTWIRTSDYRHDSSQPLNPDTFENTWETPEARKALNKEEDIRAYSAGNVQAVGKQKRTLLDNWLPIIFVIAVIIIGYMLYTLTQKTDMLGQAINVLQQMMMGQ